LKFGSAFAASMQKLAASAGSAECVSFVVFRSAVFTDFHDVSSFVDEG
jgi:hypothetical protein